MIIEEISVKTKTGQSLCIRSPHPQDAAKYLEYLRQLFRESYKNLNRPADAHDTVSVAEEAESIRQYENHPTNFILSVICDGRIVGGAKLTTEPTPFLAHCGMLGMGLLSQYQGQGVGKLLLKHALEEAKRLGIWNIQLRVRTYNESAIKLYEAFGFKRIGTLKEVACIDGNLADEHLYQRIAEH